MLNYCGINLSTCLPRAQRIEPGKEYVGAERGDGDHEHADGEKSVTHLADRPLPACHPQVAESNEHDPPPDVGGRGGGQGRRRRDRRVSA